ncbi:hypothetical protein [uncultured Herbaspirillum sp.]|uniref:hypothetical protein n=1 Tax=uncultured Herbaspirillum sp. TaxID=160236 RepID=UPI00260BE0E4|nr:hypothetical protein [uncultured Herbaspirillum sp.]
MSDRIRPDIPLDWSAEQAAAVLEFLQILQDQLWMLYAADIQRLKRQEQQTIAPDDTSSPPF